MSPPLKPQHMHETKPAIVKPIATTTSTTTAPFEDEYHNSLLKCEYYSSYIQYLKHYRYSASYATYIAIK